MCKPPVYGILLWQPECTKTVYFFFPVIREPRNSYSSKPEFIDCLLNLEVTQKDLVLASALIFCSENIIARDREKKVTLQLRKERTVESSQASLFCTSS